MEDNSQVKLAIQAALTGDWEKAAQVNSKILKDNPEDCEALNRLARAYFELCELEKAKVCYQKVLEIDPANSIATKNLKLLAKGNGNNGRNGKTQNLSLDIFLSEPGRTKLVNLVNLATPATLSILKCGEQIQIVVKKHQIVIENQDGEYLGAIPDDLSHYLISLTKAGNHYEAFIKAVKTNILTVIIWEKIRAAKFANQPSFLARKQSRLVKIDNSASDISEAELAESSIEFSEG